VSGKTVRGRPTPPFPPSPPGFLPFGPGNPPEPIPLVGTFLVLVTIVAITAWHVGRDISLHHEIARRAWHCKLVWAMVNSRQHAGEVVVWRWCSRGPFEGCCLPWIVGRPLTFEDAPNEVEIEDQLGRDSDHCRH